MCNKPVVVTYIKKSAFRLGITGLPGAGKTALSHRLAPKISNEKVREIALIQGDRVLPQNILAICNLLDRFVVEHICLAQLCARSSEQILDAIVFLDISPEECKSRCDRRSEHYVGVVSFEELYREICSGIANLTNNQEIALCIINGAQQNHIIEYDLTGIDLMRFLFPNTYLVQAYE